MSVTWCRTPLPILSSRRSRRWPARPEAAPPRLRINARTAQPALQTMPGDKNTSKPGRLHKGFVNFLIETAACWPFPKTRSRKRSGIMDSHSVAIAHVTEDANRRLVRFFSICLSSLVFVYSLLSVRLFIEGEAFGLADWALVAIRALLGVTALVVVIYPAWLARPLERQIELMGSLFEGEFVKSSTREKIRLIVLVTMVSLLLELIMIRWLASVFPVFSFFKNFTLLACFLGLGAGYAVAEKQPCAPALVLPMLTLFVGIITLLRYDLGGANELFAGLPMQEQTSISIWMDKLNWFAL